MLNFENIMCSCLFCGNFCFDDISSVSTRKNRPGNGFINFTTRCLKSFRPFVLAAVGVESPITDHNSRRINVVWGAQIRTYAADGRGSMINRVSINVLQVVRCAILKSRAESSSSVFCFFVA